MSVCKWSEGGERQKTREKKSQFHRGTTQRWKKTQREGESRCVKLTTQEEELKCENDRGRNQTPRARAEKRRREEKGGGVEKESALIVAAAFSLLCTYEIIKLRMANES